MTRDVSDSYREWAHGGQAAAFSPDSPYGGDALAVRSGRIDPGRAELHQAVERVLATTGSTDYDHALTIVLSQARTGTIALSQQALEGTGIVGVRAGRNGLRHHPRTGEVLALAAPTFEPLGEPLPGPEDTALWKDTASFCESRRPRAPEQAHTKSVETIMARTPTGSEQVQRWLAQGGAEVAFR